jgi:S-adenosylmethionine uptake transporter
MTQVLWVLLSTLLYATMSLFVKLASADFSVVEIVFFRALPGAVLLFAYMRARGYSLASRHWRIHLLRNTLGIVSMGLAYYAVGKLALATATTLEYTAPIFMMLYLVTMARHRPGVIDVLALVGGFAGVLLLLRPSLQQDQLAPFLAGLGSGALAAVAMLQIRRMGMLGEPTWRMMLMFTLSATLVSGIALPFTPPAQYTLRGIALLLGVAATGMIGQYALTQSFRVGQPTLVAILQYSAVVFSALYGFFIWGDRPSLMAVIGLALIVGSGVATALTMRRDVT